MSSDKKSKKIVLTGERWYNDESHFVLDAMDNIIRDKITSFDGRISVKMTHPELEPLAYTMWRNVKHPARLLTSVADYHDFYCLIDKKRTRRVVSRRDWRVTTRRRPYPKFKPKIDPRLFKIELDLDGASDSEDETESSSEKESGDSEDL